MREYGYWAITHYQSNSYSYIDLFMYNDPDRLDVTTRLQIASSNMGGNLAFGDLPVYIKNNNGGYIHSFNDLNEDMQISYFSSHFDGTWVTYMIQDASEYFVQQGSYPGFSSDTGIRIAGISTQGIGVSDHHYAEVLLEDA